MRRTLLLLALFASAATTIDVPAGAGPADTRPIIVPLAESELPKTLDPHLAGDTISMSQLMHAYECLLEHDPFQPGMLQPCLAESMPRYDSEQRTYTFKLRKDVRFADAACFEGGKGRALVASDVVWSIKRLAALPESEGFWLFEGIIAGLDDFREAALEAHESDGEAAWRKCLQRDVAGLRVIDDRTVAFQLAKSYPQFLHAMAMGYTAIIPHEGALAPNFATAPVGTGPFVLDKLTPDVIAWRRNRNFRKTLLSGVPADSRLRPFEGRPLPLADEIRYEILPDDEHVRRFKAGTLAVLGLTREDVKVFLDEALVKKGERGQALLKPEWQKRSLVVVDSDDPYLSYIAFNMQDSVFGAEAAERGRALRKALCLSIDRQAYVEKLLGGLARPADRLVPLRTPGYEAAGALINQRHDSAHGRKLLQQAGFKLVETDGKWTTLDPETGDQVVLTVQLRRSDKHATEQGEWLESQAAQVGIKLQVEQNSFSKWLQRAHEGDGQAFDSGWILDYPDAQNVMQLLYGPNAETGLNYARFSDQKYDALYRELAGLDDVIDEQRKRKGALLASMHQIVDHETPWVTLTFHRRVVLHQSDHIAAPPDPFNFAAAKYKTMTSGK